MFFFAREKRDMCGKTIENTEVIIIHMELRFTLIMFRNVLQYITNEESQLKLGCEISIETAIISYHMLARYREH